MEAATYLDGLEWSVFFFESLSLKSLERLKRLNRFCRKQGPKIGSSGRCVVGEEEETWIRAAMARFKYLRRCSCFGQETLSPALTIHSPHQKSA